MKKNIKMAFEKFGIAAMVIFKKMCFINNFCNSKTKKEMKTSNLKVRFERLKESLTN